MFKSLALLGFACIPLAVNADCATRSSLPDDQIRSLKANEEVYFKSAHAYQIVNVTNQTQQYMLCNVVNLTGKGREHFEKQECNNHILKPLQSYVMNEKMYTYAYFQHKGSTVDVRISSWIQGDCKQESIITAKLEVY